MNNRGESFSLTVGFKGEGIQVCGYLNEKGNSVLKYAHIHFQGQDIESFLSEVYLEELEQIILKDLSELEEQEPTHIIGGVDFSDSLEQLRNL